MPNLTGQSRAALTPSASIKRLLPWLVAVAFFMETLDTTILNTAVPVMSEALGVAPLSMKSVLASYTLSLAVFIQISGWMADRFGTRRVFASAIGLFTLGSVLCGISSNIHLLVACRMLQGCGGAMMVPVGRLTLVRTFDKSELIRTMSFVAIPALIGPMLGPIAGGLIVGYLQWRFLFFVNLPIGIAGLVLVYLNLPDFREEMTPPLDVVGLILFGSGVALLSYVLEIFGEHTLSLGEILGLLSISLVLILGYGLHATRTAFPLLQLDLFRIRTFSTAVSGGFFTRLGIGGVPFLLPLLYQVGLGFTPVQSGLLIMPQAVAAIQHKSSLAENSRSRRLSWRVDLQHDRPRFPPHVICDHRDWHRGLGHSAAGVLLWRLYVFAIYQHEYAGLCRYTGGNRQQCELHRQHHAADVGELRCRGGGAGHGIFHTRQRSFKRRRDDSRPP